MTKEGEEATLLDAFLRFAEKESYLDCDWWSEEPTLLERWFKSKARSNFMNREGK